VFDVHSSVSSPEGAAYLQSSEQWRRQGGRGAAGARAPAVKTCAPAVELQWRWP